jgi:uncharacterized protein (DUF58 family)
VRAVELTTRGRCLLTGGVATAGCALVLDERDLLRAGAFVALLPLLALLVAVLGRRGVRARRDLAPDRLPVGAPATVTLHVAGRGAGGPLELTDTVPDAAGAATEPRFPVGSSPATVEYRLRPGLRGAHRVGPLVARGTDPLGLAGFTRAVPGAERLLVLPRVVALRGLPPTLGSRDGAHGAGAAGAGHGRADVLVRPYRSGDELRRVHWRSTARHDELMVRLEERPWRGGVTVLLDRRAAAHRGHGGDASLEWAVSFAASAYLHLRELGEPATLVTEDGAAPEPAGPEGVLDALAVLRPSARTGLAGPPLPAAGDVLAVLGAVDPAELTALLGRRPGAGHAVLLDVATWGGAAEPVSATAAALRAAGWVVARAARGVGPERVWAELVTAPAPGGAA